MRRLIQFGTILFLLVMFLAPLAECFDRWDAPGLFNDTEFSVFALVFALCLLLVVCILIAARSLLPDTSAQKAIPCPSDHKRHLVPEVILSIFIPPRQLPLRI